MVRRLAFSLLGVAALMAAQAGPARTQETRDRRFDDGWRFYRGDAPGAERPDFDDRAWRALDLPHDWSIEDLPGRTGRFDLERSPGAALTGWTIGGTGWYRKSFRLPGLAPDQRAAILFEGVYMESDVWLNGSLLGSHTHGYTSYGFDLTPYLNRDGDNVLAVRVRNEGSNSRWYSGSGIYRHVWLAVTGDVHVPLWGIAVSSEAISKERATVNTAVELVNAGKANRDASVAVTLFDSRGRKAGTGQAAAAIAAGGTAGVVVSCKVDSPQLWSADSPALYRAVAEIRSAGRMTDHVETRFGIRSIEVDAARGLRINGEMVKLKGGCVHHDNGLLGAVAIDRAEERRVELLKAAGFNAIRCAHNPPSPAFLDACDRLGIFVMDEAFDIWQDPKVPNDYHRFFDQSWERDLTSMVRRDRNHPSVILWSLGNEIPERAEPKGMATRRRLVETVKKLDATRPVTEAICGYGVWDAPGTRAWTDTDAAHDQLDIASYNLDWAGGHDEWKKVPLDHERRPNRVILSSEAFALEACVNWLAVEKHPYFIGDFVWTGWDYLGESGLGRSYIEGTDPGHNLAPPPIHIAGSGDIDILGHRKPQSFYREAVWRPGVLGVAVHQPLPPGQVEKLSAWGWPDVRSHWTWAGQEGKKLAVSVYSSCDRVKLMLNGRVLGEKATTRAEQYRADFEVPYEPGELVAIGYRTGKAPAKVTLRTAGPATRLRISADRNAIRADRNDLAFVSVEAVDAQGTLVPGAASLVRFAIQGVGEMAAVGNADPKDLASVRAPSAKLYRGRGQVIVRPRGEAGTITLRAESDGLEPASVLINVR